MFYTFYFIEVQANFIAMRRTLLHLIFITAQTKTIILLIRSIKFNKWLGQNIHCGWTDL